MKMDNWDRGQSIADVNPKKLMAFQKYALFLGELIFQCFSITQDLYGHADLINLENWVWDIQVQQLNLERSITSQ